jgi:hypothetical protein
MLQLCVSAACDEVACPPGSTGTSVTAGCACGSGQSGAITATAAAPHYTSTCACDANYRSDGNGGCVACAAGKTKPAGDPANVASACDDVPCPAGSVGATVAGGCSCPRRHSGGFTATTAAPYHTSDCAFSGGWGDCAVCRTPHAPARQARYG